MPRRSPSSSSKQASGFPSYLTVPPRYGTLRNFDNPTYGDRIALTARLLGKPFLPHQQYMADVLGEVDPRTGIRIYREGYVTLMRQGGKTTFVISYKSHRALDCATPQVLQFAAQDGIEAKKKWLQHAKLIKRSALGSRIVPGSPITSNGKEIFEWDTGSTEVPLSGSEGSGHGDTVNLGLITEAWAHRDSRYIDTMQPAMNADPSAQLLAESTAGTAASLYWNEQIPELRARMDADPRELTQGRIALFDWSFAEDDDIGSIDTWRRRIPQLGTPLLRLEEVEHAWRNATTPKKIRAFKRGYGNLPDRGAGEESTPFGDEAWEASAVTASIVGPRAFTLDIAPDRSWSSIGWAGLNEHGVMQGELLKHERSTHWVLPYFGDLFDRNPRAPRRVYVVATGGQAAIMADRFDDADIEMVVLPRSEYAAACAQYFDGITETVPTIVHRKGGQLDLDIAVAGAAWTSTQPRVWDPGKSSTVISPLVAVSIAPWAFNLEQERAAAYDVESSVA